jgi:hypothetical protein
VYWIGVPIQAAMLAPLHDQLVVERISRLPCRVFGGCNCPRAIARQVRC